MKKALKSKIEFFLFRIFYKLFKMLPYPFVEKMITQIFIFAGMILGIRKKRAKMQLKMVFPEKSSKEIREILIGMYRNMGITTAETYFGNTQKLFDKAIVDGWEILDKAVKMGKGVILTTGHLGNWELAGRYIAANYKMGVVGRKLRNRYLDSFTNKLREKENIIIIDRKKALRPIIKLLKENYIVSLLMDQNAGRNGILTDFLGFPASTFVGAAKIAIKTGCPIVPAFAIRLTDGTHRFICEEIIYPEKYENTLESIKELTELVSKKLEKYILKYPQQWFWVHRRWRGAKKARKI